MGQLIVSILVLLTATFLPLFVYGQNLVPNGGFEEHHYCPKEHGKLIFLKFWHSPNNGTPDHFNLCNEKRSYKVGYSWVTFHQLPFSGSGHIGLALRSSHVTEPEGIQVKLNEKLKANKKYCLKMYIYSKDEEYPEYINYSITNNKFNDNADLLHFNDFKKIYTNKIQYRKYIPISSVYRAKGNEEWLTIGLFNEGVLFKYFKEFEQKYYGIGGKGYIFIDDVSLIEIDNDEECRCSELINIDFALNQPIILNNLFFETNAYTLKPSSFDELNYIIIVLNKNPDYNIKIIGHTDNIGTDKANLELSLNRAKSVYNYLTNNQINSERISYEGYGSSQPLLPNTTAENRAKNRRVEIIFK